MFWNYIAKKSKYSLSLKKVQVYKEYPTVLQARIACLFFGGKGFFPYKVEVS